MEQTTIDERIFTGIEISMQEGKVMATGSKRGVLVFHCGWLEIRYAFSRHLKVIKVVLVVIVVIAVRSSSHN